MHPGNHINNFESNSSKHSSRSLIHGYVLTPQHRTEKEKNSLIKLDNKVVLSSCRHPFLGREICLLDESKASVPLIDGSLRSYNYITLEEYLQPTLSKSIVHKFCKHFDLILSLHQTYKKLALCTGKQGGNRLQKTAFLLGCYAILVRRMTPDAAWSLVQSLPVMTISHCTSAISESFSRGQSLQTTRVCQDFDSGGKDYTTYSHNRFENCMSHCSESVSCKHVANENSNDVKVKFDDNSSIMPLFQVRELGSLHVVWLAVQDHRYGMFKELSI